MTPIVPLELLTRVTLDQTVSCLLGHSKPDEAHPDSQVLYDFCVSNGIGLSENHAVVEIDTVTGTPLHMWLLWEAMSSMKSIQIVSQEDANLRRGLCWWLGDDPEYRRAPVLEQQLQRYPPGTWHAYQTYLGKDALWECVQIGRPSDASLPAQNRAQLIVNLEKHLPSRVQIL